MLNGQPRRAKIDPRSCRILLSAELKRHERKRELFHELRHAWVEAHGRASDDEADADQFADATLALTEQYLGQGGDATLESLDPAPEKSPNQAAATIVLRDYLCGKCGKPAAIGDVINGLPKWSARHNAFTMDRGIVCDLCNDLPTVWRELCTEDGEPVGTILPFPPPRFLNGAQAAQWFAENRIPQLRAMA